MTTLRPLIPVSALSLLLALAFAACDSIGGTNTPTAAPEAAPTSTAASVDAATEEPAAPEATPTSSVASVDTEDAPPAPTPAPDPTSTPMPDPIDEADEAMEVQVGATAPDLAGIDSFINADPFTLEALRGDKVVLIDFWTYTCVNCIRTLPFIKEWHEKYADAGLVIVGVHAPEFEFEKLEANVHAEFFY